MLIGLSRLGFLTHPTPGVGFRHRRSEIEEREEKQMVLLGRVVRLEPTSASGRSYANYTDVIQTLDTEIEQVYTQINGYRTTPTIPRTHPLLRMRARVGFAATGIAERAREARNG